MLNNSVGNVKEILEYISTINVKNDMKEMMLTKQCILNCRMALLKNKTTDVR